MNGITTQPPKGRLPTQFPDEPKQKRHLCYFIIFAKFLTKNIWCICLSAVGAIHELPLRSLK